MPTTTDHATVAQLTQEMAEAARWAPSVHNTQPWRFRAVDDGLAVLTDPERGLGRLDPLGRMRMISCGAAVLNAETALRGRGVTPRVTLLPWTREPDVVALVRVGPERPPADLDRRLAETIPRRRAHRRVHRPQALPDGLVDDVALEVRRLGARLTVADEAARRRLAHLLARAVRDQAAAPELVEEVEGWVRHWGSVQPDDGVPVANLGTGPFPVDSLVHDGAVGEVLRERDVAEVLSWSTVTAVSTPGDGPRDWLTAGRALERLWLRASEAGLALSYTDQATQHPPTRRELPEIFDLLGHVQVVVRLGHPLVEMPVTPRRPLGELLA